MTIVCKVEACPYRSSSGFCRKRVLGITQHGLCNHIYDKNGQPKPNWMQPVDEKFMEGYKNINKEQEENDNGSD